MVRLFHTHPNRYRFFILEKNIGGEKTGGMWTGGRRESPVGKETIMVDVTQRSELSTASTLAKIATDPGLSKEFDQSLTADAIERMWAVPLPDRPEQRSDAGLPMPDPGIDPNSGNGPMGPGIGM